MPDPKDTHIPDAPEADVLEQHQEVGEGGAIEDDDTEPAPPAVPAVDVGLETPEADALEQAQEVPDEGDDDRL